MTLPAILLLGVQAIVFAIWAGLVFRLLFALRADAVAASGRAFPGLSATLAAFRDGATARRYAGDRRRIGILTVLLIGLSALAPMVLPAG